MGCNEFIKHNIFPIQSDWVGKRVMVCFHYDTENSIMGTIVRDDRGEPGETIIKLDNGKYVRATECQYALR